MYLEKSVFSFEVSLVNKFGVFELSKKQFKKTFCIFLKLSNRLSNFFKLRDAWSKFKFEKLVTLNKESETKLFKKNLEF